jgi:primosomal replication protein N
MNELSAIETALLDILGNDTVLAGMVGDRIYSEVAPQGVACPYIVFTHRTGRDTKAVNKKRLLTQANYVIKVVSSGQTYSGITEIAEQMDTILEQARPVVDGQRVIFTREQPIGYAETSNGMLFRHLGGLYQVTIDPDQ